MTEVSLFNNHSVFIENKNLENVLNNIKNGTYKTSIDNYRSSLKINHSEKASQLKKQLIGFTVSGTFNNGRKAKDISKYSNYIILDIDKLNQTELDSAIKTTRIAPYTYASFISPSQNGLKIIVKVNSSLEHHKTAFNQVVDYYEQALNISIDTSGKDVSRLCYVSYDENLFLNKNADVFNVIINKEINNTQNNMLTEEENFQKCIDFTNSKLQYINGNRNNYIHLLACNCNRVGIFQDTALQLILQRYDLNPIEIKASVKSAYSNIQDFATFANFATTIPLKVNAIPLENQENKMLNMPYLPNHIFNNLPSILKQGCEVLTDKRERDVFLTGALPILAGCMHNVNGSYRGKTHYANLYSFIIAPAASGKGALTFSKDLGNKYHNQLVDESKALKKQYDMELKEYNKRVANRKIDTANDEPPSEPPFKVLYIPANNSSARVIQHLQEGDEQGVFCETEADSMGNVLKQDWGSYSDILRKSFHHEPISYSRKTDKEWVEIQKPKLSVALAGTPGQVQNLIKSAEDGLFSRFLFYTFKSELEWIDAGEHINGVNLTKHFDMLSSKTLEFINFLKYNTEIDFKLTLDQWKQLNTFGRESLFELAQCLNEDLSSTTKRFGVILFRICMIITSLRYFDNGESSTTYICTDEDFQIALALLNVYKEHSIFMFNKLPKTGDVTDTTIIQYFNALPQKFQRKAAIGIALEKFQIKERTADSYLKKLNVGKYLEKTRSGFYQKLK